MMLGLGLSMCISVGVIDMTYSRTLEQYGGVGDGVTDCSAALAAFVTDATALAAAGTPAVLMLGAATYVINSGTYIIPSGGIRGKGRGASRFQYNADAVFLQLNSNDTHLSDFTIIGDSGTSAQWAIQCGSDSPSVVMPTLNVLIDVAIKDCHNGMLFTNGPVTPHVGPIVVAPDIQIPDVAVTSCGIRVQNFAEYVSVINPKIQGVPGSNFGYGLDILAGNFHAANVNITECNRGVNLAAGAGNGGHGTISGGCINHCAAPVYATGDFNGFHFGDVDMYVGELVLNTGKDMVFDHCHMALDAGGAFGNINVENGGTNNLIKHCTFANDPTVVVNGTGSVRFEECYLRSGGVPSVIAGHIQRAYTFPSDANQTLTNQESTCEQLVIAAGVITAARTLTFSDTAALARSRKLFVVNNNAQTVNVKWSTGAAAAVATGVKAIVTSDGTNAIVLN